MVEAAWQDLPQRRGCGCGGSWDHQPSCTTSPPVPQALGQPCPAPGKATAMSHPWDSCVPILGQSQPCPIPGTAVSCPWDSCVPCPAPLCCRAGAGPGQCLWKLLCLCKCCCRLGCVTVYIIGIYIYTHTLCSLSTSQVPNGTYILLQFAVLLRR